MSSREWKPGNDEQPLGGKVQFALLKAYVLGDRILASGFRETVKKAIIRIFTSQGMDPHFASINFAFANLPPDDVILTLLVDANRLLYDGDGDGRCVDSES